MPRIQDAAVQGGQDPGTPTAKATQIVGYLVFLGYWGLFLRTSVHCSSFHLSPTTCDGHPAQHCSHPCKLSLWHCCGVRPIL